MDFGKNDADVENADINRVLEGSFRAKIGMLEGKKNCEIARVIQG